MNRRTAIANMGSVGFLSCLAENSKADNDEVLNDRLSSEIFLFRVIPSFTFPVIRKISYIEIEDNSYFEEAHFYGWITIDQLQNPGTIFNKILKVIKGRYTADHLIEILNWQLDSDDNIEFYRSEQGQIKARILKLTGSPEPVNFPVSNIS